MISLEAVALEQEKILRGSRGFGLGHQARFADACFTGQQGNLPLTIVRLIDQRVERGEFIDTVNEDRADNWFMKRCLHDIHCLLVKNWTTWEVQPLH